MKISNVFILLLVFWLYAEAKISDKALAKCASITSNTARLDCFDALAKEKSLDVLDIQTVQGKGKWVVRIEKNPLDLSQKVFLSLDADAGANKWGGKISLHVTCQQQLTEVFINWGEYIQSEADILTRLGQSEARSLRWHLSKGRKETYHNEPVVFLKNAEKVDKLYVEIVTEGENTLFAKFDLRGLKGAMKPLKKACPW